SRLRLGRREGRADPGSNRRPPRAPGRGAGAPNRPRPGGRRRRGGRIRAPVQRSELMLAPEVETRPWQEQLELDDAGYRAQLAYLYERSAFYRDKLTASGFASADAAGVLTAIARLPLTEKEEIRATRTPANPFGTHLCVEPS